MPRKLSQRARTAMLLFDVLPPLPMPRYRPRRDRLVVKVPVESAAARSCSVCGRPTTLVPADLIATLDRATQPPTSNLAHQLGRYEIAVGIVRARLAGACVTCAVNAPFATATAVQS